MAASVHPMMRTAWPSTPSIFGVMALVRVVELADAIQHALIDHVAGGQCRVTQLVGRGEARVLQTGEQRTEFLLQLGLLVLIGTAQRRDGQLVVLDLADQGLRLLDENTRFHSFFHSWDMRTGMPLTSTLILPVCQRFVNRFFQIPRMPDSSQAFLRA